MFSHCENNHHFQEPTTLPPMVSAPAFSHVTPVANGVSQGLSSVQSPSPSLISQETNLANDSVQEHKPLINPIQQSIRPGGPANVSILNNLSQHRSVATIISGGMPGIPMSGTGQSIGSQQVVQNTAFGSNTPITGNSNIAVSSSLGGIQSNIGISGPPVTQGGSMGSTQLGQGGINTNQNMISSLGTTTVSSAPAMMPTPGMAQQAGVNSLGVTNSSAMNMPIVQHPNAQQQQQQQQQQQPPPKYVKIWEVKDSVFV